MPLAAVLRMDRGRDETKKWSKAPRIMSMWKAKDVDSRDSALTMLGRHRKDGEVTHKG